MLPPGFLNSGGNGNRDIGCPFCYFGYFFVFYIFEEEFVWLCDILIPIGILPVLWVRNNFFWIRTLLQSKFKIRIQIVYEEYIRTADHLNIAKR
jgi:hypothetical protein